MRAEVTDVLPPQVWEAIRGNMDPLRSFIANTWVGPWARHLHRSGTPLRYVVSRDEGEPVAVFPFVSRKTSGLTALSLAGPYLPVRGIPATHPHAAAALAEAFTDLREGVALHLGPVEDNDPAVVEFLGALRERGWRLRLLHQAVAYVVDLPPTHEEFRARVSKRLLKNLRNDVRRIEREGSFETELHTGLNGDAWGPLIAELGAIETQSRNADEYDLWFAGEENAAFWSEALRDAELSDRVKVWILRRGGVAVSHCFALDSGSQRYILANTYVESVQKLSTGKMLYQRMFEDAIERGLERVHIGQGDSGYKTRWGAQPRQQIQSWLALRPGFRGAVLSGLLRLRSMLKKKPAA